MEALNKLGGSNSIMKLLQRAVQQAKQLASPRALGLAMLAMIGALLPTTAFAEGENVVLQFSKSQQGYLWASLGLGVLALFYGLLYIRNWVMAQSPGDDKMQEVGLAIKDGALAYLRQQIRTMAIFIAILAVGLFLLYNHLGTPTAILVSVCFIAGVAASYVAGYSGMLMAVNANMRTAHAALSSYKLSLEIAFRSGAVAGMVTVGVGLIGASTILLLFPDKATTLLIGFGFGGSLAALFMRVGGGIFTKAADVGADLVGKVEAGIPEDDPRNPATIADNVGDNVGDCAGMAADIFESYEVTLVAAIVLGAATAAIFDTATWTRLIIFALVARGVGVIASIAGIQMVKGSDDIDSDPLAAIRKGFYASAAIAGVLTAVVAFFLMGGTKGTEIKTTQLTSLDAMRRPDLAKVSKALKDLNKQMQANPTATANPMAELAKNPDVIAAGLSDPKFGSVLQGMARVDDSRLPALLDLSEYHSIDFAGNSPVLNYSTIKPNATAPAGSPNSYGTLQEVYGTGQMKLFLVEISGAAQPGAPETSSDQWAGPITRADLDAAIAKAPSGRKISVLEEKTVTLFTNDAADNIVIGLQGPAPHPLQLPWADNGPFGGFWKESPSDVKAADDKHAPLDPLRQVQPAIIQSNVVPWWTFFAAIAFGLVMAFAIEMLTDYYVSTHKKPTQEVANVSSAGPAPMIITGFAYASESSVFMVFAIVFALMFPLFLFNPAMYGGYILSFYGIALVGLGLLTTTGYVLAMDTFGPISDNAQGVFEMSGAGHTSPTGSKAVQRLDAAGNTTKALTKGFAIATAVVAAVALFHSYLADARLGSIGLRLDIPEIFLGLLIGSAAPYLFSAFAINAVGRAAFELINEVRKQFREDKGIMAGTSKPNYGRCVAIVTKAAQKELLGPGILAIALPVAVGFGFSIGKPATVIGGHAYNLTGAQALGGFLAGAIASGQLLAVLLANSGGMWDNAKKLIEDGLHGGKGSEAHKAGVVCDTVGDPFKDTAGPALNPLIKVMNLVALLLAGVIIMPLSNGVLILITLLAVGALAVSIYLSKKGSMSSALAEAGTAEENAAALSESNAPSVPKKRLTVEDPEETENP